MNKNPLYAGYDQEGDEPKRSKSISIPYRQSFRLKSKPDFPRPLGDHCHGGTIEGTPDITARRKLVLASILCLFFMIGEIVGGALAHSLAIMTDAAHLLTDFASFMISLLALFLASRPSTKKMSFGWHRAEVVGALASVLMIWLVTGILVYLAVVRVIHRDYEINGKIMLITSVIGVGVNVIMVFTLHDHGHSHGQGHEHSHSGNHGHSHDLSKSSSAETKNPTTSGHQHSHSNGHTHSSDSFTNCEAARTSPDYPEDQPYPAINPTINLTNEQLQRESQKQNITVRAALIHVIGDLLQSLGVMIAAMIIYFKPKLKIVDPICTFMFSVLVLITTINILRDTLNVLMEATPRGLEFNEVKNSLIDIPGVVEVHNLRMWSLTMNKTAVSVHLAIDSQINAQRILREASQILRQRYLVHDVTIQLEEYVEEMADCDKCHEPSK